MSIPFLHLVAYTVLFPLGTVKEFGNFSLSYQNAAFVMLMHLNGFQALKSQ